MSLALSEGNWWKCSGDEIWAMNLRRSNFVAQSDNVITAVGTKLQRCNVRDILGTFREHFKGKDFLKSSGWENCFCVKSV